MVLGNRNSRSGWTRSSPDTSTQQTWSQLIRERDRGLVGRADSIAVMKIVKTCSSRRINGSEGWDWGRGNYDCININVEITRNALARKPIVLAVFYSKAAGSGNFLAHFWRQRGCYGHMEQRRVTSRVESI